MTANDTIIQELKEKGVDGETILKITERLMPKYGLIFERTETPPFQTVIHEAKEMRVEGGPESLEHHLIEGDNLHALQHLQATHRGTVDVIYIDPPYNTLNKDFRYNDHYVDKEDSWRHSKWLSFMNERLMLARELLTDDGVIFISIDDNEMAQLKLLCDSVFGEQNFMGNITVQTASNVYGLKASSVKKSIVKTSEYLLVYSKNKDFLRELTPLRTQKLYLYDTHYSTYIKNKKRRKLVDVLNSDTLFLEKVKRNVIKLSELNGYFSTNIDAYDYFLENYSEDVYYTKPYKKEIEDKNIIQQLKDGNIVDFANLKLNMNQEGKVDYIVPISKTVFRTDDFNAIVCDSAYRGNIWNYSQDFNNVAKEGNTDFKNGKKPKRLIRDIMKLINHRDAVVLDFFAGSGTTGHAVMSLNEEDGGNRQFILCTNNENNICEEVTYERIKRVINGYTTPKGKKVAGLAGNSLRYWKVDATDI